MCGEISQIEFQIALEFGVPAKFIDCEILHQALTGKPNSFNHACTIIGKGENRYLTDLTFIQFLKANGQIVNNGAESDLNWLNTIAQELIENGYIKFNKENLYEYLRLISTNTTSDYLARLKTQVGTYDLDIIDGLICEPPLPTRSFHDQYGRYFKVIFPKISNS